MKQQAEMDSAWSELVRPVVTTKGKVLQFPNFVLLWPKTRAKSASFVAYWQAIVAGGQREVRAVPSLPLEFEIHLDNT